MKVVRYYGLYASTAKDELSLCRAALGQEPVNEPDTLDWQNFCEAKGNDHPERCPICGCRLIRVMEIPRMPDYSPGEQAIPEAA